MATRNQNDDFERSAAGMDYEDPIREHAASLGAKIADGGPEAIFEEIENLLPSSGASRSATSRSPRFSSDSASACSSGCAKATRSSPRAPLS